MTEAKVVDLTEWRKYTKEDIMTWVYWMKGQLPPSDPILYEKNWQSVKKQLEEKMPEGGVYK